MPVTALVRPDEATTIGSPRLIRPPAIVPAKPRKSRCGRLTHCTGRRNGALRRSSSTSMRSRWSSRYGPSCQGVRGLSAEMLSPTRAEIGIGDQRAEVERLGEGGESLDDAAKCRFVVVDQVDLVDRQHDMADAEQRGDDRVAMGLGQQPLARVDQQDGEIGVGGAGRHVAGVLLVAGRVGDDERAPRRGEIAVGDVDGDALLALGLEAVDQQREVDVGADRAVLLRVAFERRELVVEDQLLLVEQPADQGRLAVVDRAAGQQAQGRQRVLAQGRVHQKYPSRFFFSIDADSSLSISRPWRSEVVEACISAMIASSVSASDSIAPVSG